MRLLGIDYGSKRIGIAVGDTETRLALPLTTIANRGRAFVFNEIRHLIAEENIEKIVVGLPLSLRGEETAQTAATMSFVGELKKIISAPVVTEDERLSSAEINTFAAQIKSDARRVGKKAPKIDLDAASAALILQRYLDRQLESSV